MSDPAFSSPSGAAPSPATTLLRLLNAFPASLALPADAPQLIGSLSELGSGLSLFHFLHALDPSHFDPEPLQQSCADLASRRANIQYLLDSLETFFEESMGRAMDLSFLDVAAICSDSDGEENDAQRVQLLELVLLCAINSAEKEQVIEAIMSMTDAEQQTLMTLINQQMERAGGGGSAAGVNDSRASGGASSFVPMTPSSSAAPSAASSAVLSTPLRGAGSQGQDHDSSFLSSASTLDTPASASTVQARAATATAEAATAAAHKQVDSLLAEKSLLTKQLDAASREAREWKRQAAEALEKLSAQGDALTAQHKAVLAQREQEVERAAQAASKTELARLSKEVARGEARASDLEQTARQSQEQLLALQRELAKAQELAEERSGDLARLTDDLHLAQTKLADLASLQSKHEKLRSKLGELDALKATTEALESENSRQLDRIIELESSSKELDAMRMQLNRLRDLNVAADSALLDRTLAEESAKQEVLELKEGVQAAREEQRALSAELKAAKQERDEALAKLRMAAAAPGRSATPAGGNDLLTDAESTSLASDASSGAENNPRATIRRLEFELAKLRAEASSASAAASAADASATAGPTPMEVALLRSQKDALQEKYLESQRKSAALNAELNKARRENEDKVSALERLLDEEKEKAAQEKDAADAALASAAAAAAAQATVPPAALEEMAQLRQEASDLHEQLDVMRAAAAAASSPSSAAAAAAAAVVAESPNKAARAAASSAALAQLQSDLDASLLRSKKLEAYIKQSQKKSKLLEEEHVRTQQQLQSQHEAYKVCRGQLVEREREIVEREKARATENTHAVRERKLMSSAFYSMGMEYHAALMSGRAVGKNVAAAPAGRSWISQQRSAAAANHQ